MPGAGHHELADQLSRHATELGARSDFVVAHADASLDRADVLAMAGDNVGAVDSAKQAVRLYEVKGKTTQAEKRTGPDAHCRLIVSR